MKMRALLVLLVIVTARGLGDRERRSRVHDVRRQRIRVRLHVDRRPVRRLRPRGRGRGRLGHACRPRTARAGRPGRDHGRELCDADDEPVDLGGRLRHRPVHGRHDQRRRPGGELHQPAVPRPRHARQRHDEHHRRRDGKLRRRAHPPPRPAVRLLCDASATVTGAVSLSTDPPAGCCRDLRGLLVPGLDRSEPRSHGRQGGESRATSLPFPRASTASFRTSQSTTRRRRSSSTSGRSVRPRRASWRARTGRSPTASCGSATRSSCSPTRSHRAPSRLRRS